MLNKYYQLYDNIDEKRRLWYESEEDVIIRLHRNEMLEDFLENMKEAAKKILTDKQLLYFFLFIEGKSITEIATFCGVSKVTIHQNFFGKKQTDGKEWGGIFKKIYTYILEDKELSEKYKVYINGTS